MDEQSAKDAEDFLKILSQPRYVSERRVLFRGVDGNYSLVAKALRTDPSPFKTVPQTIVEQDKEEWDVLERFFNVSTCRG